MTSSPRLTVRQARDLGRAILAAPNGRAAHDTLRPRGVGSPWRSRPPLWVVLLLADRAGRLFRAGDDVALREPRREDGPPARTWLHRIDRYWDLRFAVPPVLLVAVSAVVGLLAGARPVPTLIGLVVLGVALLWVAALVLGLVVWLFRRLVPRRRAETAVQQLRILNPTLTLLHAGTSSRATDLVTRAITVGPGPLLVMADGITGPAPEAGGAGGLRIEQLPDDVRMLVARRPSDPPPHAPTTPGRLLGRDVILILAASIVMVAVAAQGVAESERSACGEDCTNHPTSYGDALYWMASRLLGGDPDGLGVAGVFGRLVGVLVTIYGLYVLVYVVGSVVRRRMDDDLRSAADVVAAYEAERGSRVGYPHSDPHDSGLLDVGDGQHVYWEACGNPAGAPAVVLHGGPGSGAGRSWTGLLDPSAYRIVLLDQRGCGRSIPDVADPAVPLDAHTTHDLVADLERLRDHLRIDRWLVLGASWGSTLGLAYAQRHPRAVSAIVLFSVCGTTRGEIDWITRGMRRYLPEEWERFRDAVPRADRDGDLAAAYARLLADRDADVRDRAAREWCAWEERHVAATTGPRTDPRYADPAFRMRFARLVTHCWRHAAWLSDHELVVGAARLAGIPGVLVHGRADISSPLDFAWQVHRAWPGSELVLVDGAGHGADEAMARAVVEATDRLRPPAPA
jgi:proline iminopeptidase